MSKYLVALFLLFVGAGAAANTQLFDQLEAKSGKFLSLDQRYQITKAIKAHDDLLRDQDAKLVNEVMAVTGLPPGQILQMAHLDGSLIAKIELTLKRKLPEAKARQIRAAEETRRSAILAAREKLAACLASIVAVSPQTVIEMLPGFGL
jgi:hypothetical protein